MNIRRAEAGDVGALNALVQASSAYDGPYRPMLDGYVITQAQCVRDEMFAAWSDGRIVGFYSLTTGEVPELDLLFVDDTIQKAGLGRALMAHMAKRAASLGLKTVKIVSHPPSAGFYERIGARRIGMTEPRGRITWAQPILELAV